MTMTHPKVTESTNLLNEFKTCTQLQFNGQLNFESEKGRKWSFYYRLGRIVWATGGNLPFRRLRRQVAQHCPQIELDKIRFRSEDLAADYWDYNFLEVLHKRQKVQREQVNAIVESIITELMFDLAQELHFATVKCDRSQNIILDTAMSFTSAEMSIKQMQESWAIWSQAGLANFSPNLAPVLRRPEELQQMVSTAVYKNFVNFINGKSTLRELAIKMNQNVLPITRSLLPYILKGIIELVEVPDIPLIITESNSNRPTSPPKKPNIPLVACVDDSPLVCEMLEEIITSHGLRFLKIQDAIQALPTLIQNKPDLIFLDLVMPIASGYEICTQLRRISAFANTPVIILTGSDGLLDRVRAKVVGSTDFISKPILADRVMSVVRKYLNPTSITTVKNQTNLETF